LPGGHHDARLDTSPRSVDGQRPGRLAGHREDEPSALAALDGIEHARDLRRLRRPREVDRARHRRLRDGADSDDQDVVGRFLASVEQGEATGGIDPDQRRMPKTGALAACEGREVHRQARMARRRMKAGG
jgi:hypothetical protein